MALSCLQFPVFRSNVEQPIATSTLFQASISFTTWHSTFLAVISMLWRVLARSSYVLVGFSNYVDVLASSSEF